MAAVSLCLAASEFATGRLLSAFDSGVYFGASSQMVAGRLPYRDFSFVQPPGGLILLSPWALVGRASTSSLGFELARIASALVVAAVAVLVSRLLRSHGRIASLTGGVAVALAPPATFEMTSVKLESYCLLLSLIAACWVVGAEGRGSRAVRWRLGGAGAMMGAAGSVKLWAFLPFLALVTCVWRWGPRQAARFVLWAAFGFAVVVAPFFAIAPRAFLSQVVAAQLHRSHNVLGDVSTISRLNQFTGLAHTPFALPHPALLVVCGSYALVSIAAFVVGGAGSLVERFFLVSTVVTTGALLWSKEFYGYYGYFLVPFAVGLAVSSVARIRRFITPGRESPAPVGGGTAARIIAASAAVVVAAAFVVLSFASVHRLSEVAAGANAPTAIDRFIAPGSCVIFDDAIQGVLSNRFVASSPSCPVIVDAGGLALSLGGGFPERSPVLARLWRHDLSRAHYVVLAGLTPLGIPWTQNLYSWFVGRFHVIDNAYSYVIYRRD